MKKLQNIQQAGSFRQEIDRTSILGSPNTSNVGRQRLVIDACQYKLSGLSIKPHHS